MGRLWGEVVARVVPPDGNGRTILALPVEFLFVTYLVRSLTVWMPGMNDICLMAPFCMLVLGVLTALLILSAKYLLDRIVNKTVSLSAFSPLAALVISIAAAIWLPLPPSAYESFFWRHHDEFVQVAAEASAGYEHGDCCNAPPRRILEDYLPDSRKNRDPVADGTLPLSHLYRNACIDDNDNVPVGAKGAQDGVPGSRPERIVITFISHDCWETLLYIASDDPDDGLQVLRRRGSEGRIEKRLERCWYLYRAYRDRL